jgi:DNA-binding SARP family transcriptional activator
VAQSLDSTADWQMALAVWEIAAQFYDAAAPSLDEEARRTLRVDLLNRKLLLLRREDTGEEYRDLVEQILEVTANPDTIGAAELRLQAVNHSFRRLVRVDHVASIDHIWDEVASLCERFPQLRFSLGFIDYMRDVAHAANMLADRATQNVVEREVERILADPAITPEQSRKLRSAVYPHLLRAFSTREELERRIAMLRELEADRPAYDVEFLWQTCLFETSIGDLASVMPRFEITLPKLKERGLLYSYSNAQLNRLFCRAAFGLPLDTLVSEARSIRPDAPPTIARNFRILSGDRLSVACALRGDAEWTRRVLESFSEACERQEPRIRVAIQCATGATNDEVLAVVDDEEQDETATLTRMLLGNATLDECAGRLAAYLALPLLRTDEVLCVRAAIDLARRADLLHGWDLCTRLRDAIRNALMATLDWLEARRMYAFITPILDRFDRFLTRGAHAARRSAVALMIRAGGESGGDATRHSRIRLAMLGSIAIQTPGEEPAKPRGVRLRTLLGLLVADRLLDEPLDHREFCRLAASDAAEIEDARKTLNLAVHRLRETIGHDAILTDGETPQLNLELVSVDLLDVHRRFIEAERAIRDAAYHRAVTPLAEALDIVAGEIPFPSLYDEFFEAAREDFENRLRLTAIKTAKGLLHDGDAMSAEGILRRAFAAMPDDEEIADLLCVALVQLGKRTEAQRVRIRMASELEI